MARPNLSAPIAECRVRELFVNFPRPVVEHVGRPSFDRMRFRHLTRVTCRSAEQPGAGVEWRGRAHTLSTTEYFARGPGTELPKNDQPSIKARITNQRLLQPKAPERGQAPPAITRRRTARGSLDPFPVYRAQPRGETTRGRDRGGQGLLATQAAVRAGGRAMTSCNGGRRRRDALAGTGTEGDRAPSRVGRCGLTALTRDGARCPGVPAGSLAATQRAVRVGGWASIRCNGGRLCYCRIDHMGIQGYCGGLAVCRRVGGCVSAVYRGSRVCARVTSLGYFILFLLVREFRIGGARAIACLTAVWPDVEGDVL